MTKNPVINAFGATLYILIIVSILNVISSAQANTPDTAFAPVIFLSLLTLSAAVMACIFFYQPVLLLLEGKKKLAVRLVVQTIGVFAGITALGLVLLFLGVI